jgi:transposase InsO family protein
VLSVMDQFTRRIIGFGIHAGTVDGVALCRMFNQAIRKQSIPKYLSSDHDPQFRFHHWQANLRVLEVEEIKSVPYSPLSRPFVERLIGTLRRECLDRTLFWTTAAWSRGCSISNITIMAIEHMQALTGARQNRALTDFDHRRISVPIDGRSIVEGCIRHPSQHDFAARTLEHDSASINDKVYRRNSRRARMTNPVLIHRAFVWSWDFTPSLYF